MRNPADSGTGSGLPEALFGRPEELIAYVEKLRSTGDLVAAAEVLREALHQGLGTAELRALLARTQRDLRLEAEEQAWLSLVAGTRASIETLLAEERVPAALAVLQEVESRHGRIPELEDLRTELEDLVAAHERQERAAALQWDTDRIDLCLQRGQLLRAQRAIRRSQARFGGEGALEARLHRCRRLRRVRRARILGLPAYWLRSARRAVAARRQERLVLARRRREAEQAARLERLEAARRQALQRIDENLHRGRLWRAEVAIRHSLMDSSGPQAELEARLRRCRRVRRVRWGRLARLPASWLERTREALAERRAARRATAERRREAAQEARNAWLESAASEVEEHLERGDSAGVRTLLAQIGKRGPELDGWTDWTRRLEALEANEQRAAREAARVRAMERIDDRLARGRLLRAEHGIRRGLAKYGPQGELEGRLQRCRRLRQVRWGRRRSRLQDSLAHPYAQRVRQFPTVARETLSVAAARSAETTVRRCRALRQRIVPVVRPWLDARTGAALTALLFLGLAGSGVFETVFEARRVRALASGQIELSAGESGAGAALANTDAVSSGDLVLDALPWGRVAAIIDAEGRHLLVGEDVFTPVRLSLPAGSYRVVLENPAVEKPAELEVPVLPGSVTRRVHEFQPVDADTYFARAWW